ncbi:hypothetical protein MNBD_GAMMA12-3975 [hydrothermal vent metagenome]|uniref:DUF1294 domain-containing protein n=1 Tax=hydrothermal vent metagenome TaxID=652676 RepID=A0A3B0Y3L8_9ZZZZ
MPFNANRFRSPFLIFGLFAIISILLLALYLYRWTLSPLFAYLLAVNATTLVFYAYDKKVAGGSLWRVPENSLHILAIIGGSPAAITAQTLLRHKTIKKSFQLVYWSIVAMQIILIVWYFVQY